jgi:hypothetical protein
MFISEAGDSDAAAAADAASPPAAMVEMVVAFAAWA